MMPRFPIHYRPDCLSMVASRLLVLGGLLMSIGCQSAEVEPRADAPVALSFYEERLLDAIERKEELEAYAEEGAADNWPEIQRRFHDLAGEFESIVADNPNQIEARLIYGKFLDFFGDEEGAREQWVAVLERDPTIAVAHQQLGTYFAEQGDFSRALAYYLTAVEHAPEEAVYHFGVGELLHSYRKGFIEEAGFSVETLESQMLDAFREAARLAPDNFVYQFRYGEAFYNVADPDWEEALAHWTRLAERESLSPLQRSASRLHRARVLAELKRFDEARALASEIKEPELANSRDALIKAIDEAKAGDGTLRFNEPAEAEQPVSDPPTEQE